MSSSNRRDSTPPDPEEVSGSQGLWRTILAGPGRSLADAFANLEKSPQVERVLRHPVRDLLSARVALTPEEGQGYWELTRIRNDLYVILTNFSYKNPRFELVPGDSLVQFNFKLSGDLTYAVSRTQPLRFNRPALHIWRQPQGIVMKEWTAPSSYERMVSISVRPEFLVENFVTPGLPVPPRLQAFLSPSGDGIDFCQLPLTSQMLEVTGKLLDNPFAGLISLSYVEALTLELLCAALANFWSLGDRPTEEYSERQLRALAAAREILMKQFAPAPTLRKLARSVGLPEKMLTRGFKAVYAETIFDFSVKCRMQHALTLLRDRHWSVDRVSEAAGYSHPTSFTTAFRRHFGLRPVDMKVPRSRLRHR
jgi:AraC-like DNA-binding protein